MQEKTKVAIIYDFDKTLSPIGMQEFGLFDFFGVPNNLFWEISNKFEKDNQIEGTLAYMFLILEECKKHNIVPTKEFFNSFGKNIEFFEGLESWFERVNKFGDQNEVEIQHFIISSGLKEIIDGSSIVHNFKEVYASKYLYQDGVAVWPGLVVDYTGKTQHLFRINKGILDITDYSVNDNMPHEIRPIQFKNMIYIGDSATDIPCMRLVMKGGGNAIGVYQEDAEHISYLHKLISNKKINFIAKADYREDSDLDMIVKEIVKKIKHEERLFQINKHQKLNIN